MTAGHSPFAGLKSVESWGGMAASGSVTALARRAADWIRHEIAIRVAVARLESLPDELLDDVGIRRIDIDKAVRDARGRDFYRPS